MLASSAGFSHAVDTYQGARSKHRERRIPCLRRIGLPAFLHLSRQPFASVQLLPYERGYFHEVAGEPR